MGKSTINRHFSIAMLNYQRVTSNRRIEQHWNMWFHGDEYRENMGISWDFEIVISQWDISHKGSYSITFTSDIGFNFFDLTAIPWDLTIKNGDFRVTSPTKILLSWGYDGRYIANDKNDTLWSSLPWLGNPGTGGVPVRKSSTIQPTKNQSFQDPTMEVLCHTRPYFVGIFPEFWALYMVGICNKLVPEMDIERMGFDQQEHSTKMSIGCVPIQMGI